VLWQIPRCQRNQDGVVASQQQIDQDDGQQARPPEGRKQFHDKHPFKCVLANALSGLLRLVNRTMCWEAEWKTPVRRMQRFDKKLFRLFIEGLAQHAGVCMLSRPETH
jgi:hypothetical protein